MILRRMTILRKMTLLCVILRLAILQWVIFLWTISMRPLKIDVGFVHRRNPHKPCPIESRGGLHGVRHLLRRCRVRLDAQILWRVDADARP